MMDLYEKEIYAELLQWQKDMQRRPSLFNKLSKRLQTKINTWIPEKVHHAITVTIKQMIRAVLLEQPILPQVPLLVKILHQKKQVSMNG